MTPKEIYKSMGFAIARLDHVRAGRRIASGTGFLVDGKMVTCEHVLSAPPDSEVRIELQLDDPGEILLAPRRAPNRITSSAEHSYDYAVFDPGLPAYYAKRGLTLAAELPEPGEAVCTLGYPFEDPHLTMARGIVSAVYKSGVATLLKLDLSVNPSNSGGPLIRERDGAVIGIVARRKTGLTKAFDELMASYDFNLKALEASRASGARFTANGIDFIQAQLATQAQMRSASRELQRSANVGIGFAVFVDALSDEPCFQQ